MSGMPPPPPPIMSMPPPIPAMSIPSMPGIPPIAPIPPPPSCPCRVIQQIWISDTSRQAARSSCPRTATYGAAPVEHVERHPSRLITEITGGGGGGFVVRTSATLEIPSPLLTSSSTTGFSSGMLYTIQCVPSPFGASASSTIKANVFVPMAHTKPNARHSSTNV